MKCFKSRFLTIDNFGITMYRCEGLGNPVTIWLRNGLRYDIIAKNFEKK